MKKALTGADKEDAKKHECDWKGCTGNPHTTNIKYENEGNGNVNRGKYIGCWPEPFCIPTPSYIDYGVTEGGTFKGLKSTKYALKKYTSTRESYKLEFHHVIPVDSIKGKAALKKNLKLLGWNINDGISNGMCLPYFKEDQIWHCLQPHRGSHPKNYIASVNEVLGPINTVCQKYCASSEEKTKKENQETLLTKIAELVEDIRRDILNWDVTIHLDTTLETWTSKVLSRKPSETTGYFKPGETKSSKPPYTQQTYSGRIYLEITEE